MICPSFRFFVAKPELQQKCVKLLAAALEAGSRVAIDTLEPLAFLSQPLGQWLEKLAASDPNALTHQEVQPLDRDTFLHLLRFWCGRIGMSLDKDMIAHLVQNERLRCARALKGTLTRADAARRLGRADWHQSLVE